MAFITKQHLSRRTFLNGMGVTMALPLLESMLPAATALAQTAAKGRTRLGVHLRAARRDDGQVDARRPRAPASSCREILQPLKPFRDRINVISDLSHPQAYGGGSATSNHNRSAATFLSGAHAEAGPRAHLGITVDQFAAQHIGQDTPLPSIELMIEDSSLSCGDGSAAPTATRFPGRDRPRRCRCRTIRRWCSSGCSATAAPMPSGARAGSSR